MSFLQDGFSRRILGFMVATSKSGELITKALDQALSVRKRGNPRVHGRGRGRRSAAEGYAPDTRLVLFVSFVTFRLLFRQIA